MIFFLHNLPRIVIKTDTVRIIGVVEKQLFDTELYEYAKELHSQGRINEATKVLVQARKPLFRENILWITLRKLLNLDIRINYLTGVWTKNAITHNLITTKGKEIISKQLNGVSTTPVTAIALGQGTTPAVIGDIALESEITTGGGQRGAATCTNQTTDVNGDTAQWVRSFPFTSTFNVSEEGLFDNNSSGGNCLARQVFAPFPVDSTVTLQITHKTKIT